MEENTIIELDDNDFAFVLDENGQLKEVYFPNDEHDDKDVPETVEKIMDLLIKYRTGNLQ